MGHYREILSSPHTHNFLGQPQALDRMEDGGASNFGKLSARVSYLDRSGQGVLIGGLEHGEFDGSIGAQCDSNARQRSDDRESEDDRMELVGEGKASLSA